MKKQTKYVAMFACAAVMLSSCEIYDYPVYTSGSVTVGGPHVSTSVSWTNASYDANGFPIFGYYYGRPVYGYTAAGAAIFSIAAITAACLVPDWRPASWYCGPWHYPPHVHYVSVPPHCPPGHHPGHRPPHHGNPPRPPHHPAPKPHHHAAPKPHHSSAVHKPAHNSRPGNHGVQHKPAVNQRPNHATACPQARPAQNNKRPAANVQRPAAQSRPAVQRPAVQSRPAVQRPAAQSRPVSRPAVQSRPVSRPSVSRPSVQRSHGGSRSHGGGQRGGHRR